MCTVIKKWGTAILLTVFLIPRILYLRYLMKFPAEIGFLDLEPSVQDGLFRQGRLIQWAGQLWSGHLVDRWEDVGISHVLNLFRWMGMDYVAGFHLFRVLFILAGGWLIVALYKTAIRHWDPVVTFGAFVIVSLYPRGIYFSSSFLSFMLPVYGFAFALIVLLNHSDWALHRSYWKTGAAALCFVVLWLCRQTVIAIMGMLVMALLVDEVLSDSHRRRSFVVFLGVLVAGIISAKVLLPASHHLTWHHIYRGLANFDNRFQIDRTDAGMVQTARKWDPALPEENIWSEPGYEVLYRKLTLETIRNHPVWYAGLLAKRAARLVILPRSGGWLPRLSPDVLQENVRFGSLVGQVGPEPTNAKVRLYVTLYNGTMLMDAGVIFFGFLSLLYFALQANGRNRILGILMLTSVLYVYIFVDAQYNDVYMAGTYVYLFSAGFALCWLAKMAWKTPLQTVGQTVFESILRAKPKTT